MNTYKKLGFYFAICSILLLSSCKKSSDNQKVDYSSVSDSTLFYYELGWKQIMDFGDYSAAQQSYRKALTFDEHFLVGKSVLASLTLNLDERLSLYNTLEKRKPK